LFVEAGLYLLEAGVYLLEASVYLREAGVYLLEAGIYLREAGVYLLEAGIYLLEASINSVEPTINVVEAGVRLAETGIQPGDIAAQGRLERVDSLYQPVDRRGRFNIHHSILASSCEPCGQAGRPPVRRRAFCANWQGQWPSSFQPSRRWTLWSRSSILSMIAFSFCESA
jgi:hypothetical protein